MNVENVHEKNQEALRKRFHIQPGYQFRPVSVHSKELHDMKREYPFFGYIDVEVHGGRTFLMFSNNDDLVAQTYFWYGPDSFESASMMLWSFLSKNSRSIFDVGSYTGVYAICSAIVNEDARVYAFEPIGRIFGRLVVNIAANRLGRRIVAEEKAVGMVEATCTMNLFQGYLTLSTGSSMFEKDNKDIVSREVCPMVSVDGYIEEKDINNVDLVKIDVEKAEIDVVLGMTETIRQHAPDMLIEVLDSVRLERLSDILGKKGYQYAVINDIRNTIGFNRLDLHRSGVLNVLFTRKDKGYFLEHAPERLREFFKRIG